MSMKHYLAARKEGLKQQHAAQARGQDPYLPVLSELVPTLNKLTQVPLGLVQIALDQIEGTATKGRTTAFSRGFMPLLEHRGRCHPRPAGAGGQRALPRLSGIFELLRRYEDQFHHLHPRGQL